MSTPDPAQSTPQSPSVQSSDAQQGGVTIADAQVTVRGDIVGRDKIVGYTAQQVTTIIAEIGTRFQPKPFDGRSPYIGLDAFSEDDADRFFGRERLVDELVARVRDSRFVVVAGPSGSGKSSLMRAGLLHALKAGALPGSQHWLYEALKPGRNPLGELARVTASLAGSLNAADDIRTRGMSDATILHQWAEIALKDQRERRAIILVDQFEEVFTQVTKEDERAAFLNLLTQAATVEQGRVTVLFTLRSDFVANCATYPQLNVLLNQQFMQVGAMQPDELVRAIALPALQVGLRIDPELIAQILNDMQDEPGELPLMQFALKDLFDAQRAKGGVIALALQDYLARGGLRQSLAHHADDALATLTPSEQQLAREVFSGLIQVGRGTQDTRRTALFEELVPADAAALSVEEIIRKLADARLLTTYDPEDTPQHDRTVTLAHEKLIEAWPWLHKLVNENREAIALHNEIAADAQEWEQHGRDASYLYTGARLATAREQLQQKKLTLSGLAQSFVQAAIAAREAEQRARQRQLQVTIGALVAAVIIFALLAAVALRQTSETANAQATSESQRAVAVAAQLTAEANRNAALSAQATAEANRAAALSAQATAEANRLEVERQQKLSRSRELAALALNQIAVDPERSILIALEAENATHTFESEDALRQAILNSPLRQQWRDVRSFSATSFSPDGKWLAVPNLKDNTVRVRSVATGQDRLTLPGHEASVHGALYSPDGLRIATWGEDNVVRVWDSASGKLVATLQSPGVLIVRYSPDGRYLVTISPTQAARLWDASNGKLLATLQTSQVGAAQFTPDSQMLVVSGAGVLDVWDVQTTQRASSIRGKARLDVRGAISPDSKWIATVSDDNVTHVWELRSGKSVTTINDRQANVAIVQFSPDGKLLLTSGQDHAARLWNTSNWQQTTTLVGHLDRIVGAWFSPDSHHLVTSSFDFTARLWDARSGQFLGIIERLPGDGGIEANFSADSRYVVTTAYAEEAHVTDTESGNLLSTQRAPGEIMHAGEFSPDGRFILTRSVYDRAYIWAAPPAAEWFGIGENSAVYEARYSPDGKLIVTHTFADGQSQLHLWDAASGASLGRYLIGGAAEQIAPNGRWLAASASNNDVNVWQIANGQVSVVLRGHSKRVNSIEFSRDSQWIATTSEDGTARVWDVTNGRELLRIGSGSHPLSSAQFSADVNTLLVAGGDNAPHQFDAHTGQERLTFASAGENVTNAQLSSSGDLIVANTATGASVWNAHNGQLAYKMAKSQVLFSSVQFSPDSKYILAVQTGQAGALAYVWEAASGKPIRTIGTAELQVTSARFSPDANTLLVSAGDGSPRLWDFASGAKLAVLRGHDKRGASAQFSPDGKYIVGAGQDGTARVYLTHVADLITFARSRVTRELTCAERQTYLHESVSCP